jgi:hypothetical protein
VALPTIACVAHVLPAGSLEDAAPEAGVEGAACPSCVARSGMSGGGGHEGVQTVGGPMAESIASAMWSAMSLGSGKGRWSLVRLT